MSTNDVAVLGVGMHPWGKWGHNFVEYGVHAIKAALDDSGLDWRDIQFVSGARSFVRSAASPSWRRYSEGCANQVNRVPSTRQVRSDSSTAL